MYYEFIMSYISDFVLIIKICFKNILNFKRINSMEFTLVTASDEKHYPYLVNFIDNFERMQKNIHNKLIIFDLGLSSQQYQKLLENKILEVRKFPFEKYPKYFALRLKEHKNKIGGFAWKPEIINILKNEGINCERIEIIKKHQTTLKKRIYSNGQQKVRIDREEIIQWEPSELNFKEYDIIILSDYNKGVLMSDWFDVLEAELIVADPKKKDFNFYKNSNIITPNLNELNSALNVDLNSGQDINRYCNSLVNSLNLEYLISKRGENGIHVFGKNEFSYNVQAHIINNPDVSGAGDTVIAIISLFYFLTKDIIFSTNIANYGASLVVGKEGTSFVNYNELESFISKDII